MGEGFARSLLALIVLLFASFAVLADRIGIYRPLDMEAMRKSYASMGKNFPEAQFRQFDRQKRKWLDEAIRLLAPVRPSNDNRAKTYRFEGRILRVIQPVNPSASQMSPDYYPKIVFQAHGEGGAPISRKPAVISAQWIQSDEIVNHIDTLADYALLMSNRHELLGVDFGSERHRESLFAALDPDGSMGLPGNGAKEKSDGIQEGALMLFGEHGAPHRPRNPMEINRAMQRKITDPLNPLHQFPDDMEISMIGAKHFPLTYALIEEYARSMTYPGYEPAYRATAKASLQILYTLSLATPDDTSPTYKAHARRYHAIGESMYVALSNILSYRVDDVGWEYAPTDKTLLPLDGRDLRRATLKLLVDGPVVPAPEISDRGRAPLLDSLLMVIEKDKDLAPSARKILERHLAPLAGETDEISALYEMDREQNRKSLWSRFMRSSYDTDPYVFPAAHAMARIGWGNAEEAKEIVEGLVTDATRLIHASPTDDDYLHPINRRAYAVLRIIARPDKYTRKDRMEYAMVAVEALNRQVARIREVNKNGFGTRVSNDFIDRWDADTRQ